MARAQQLPARQSFFHVALPYRAERGVFAAAGSARRQKHEAGSLNAPASQDNGRGTTSVGANIADGGTENDPQERAEKIELKARVQAGLLELDDDYRRILVLRDIEGFDYEEIAETIEISHAAVKSRLHRARRELARVLKDLKS